MNNQEHVVLLHGIRLSKWSLWLVERRLKRAGYDTLSISYPSTRKSLDDIADWLRRTHLTKQFWDEKSTVHFVTHSMGGLVARRYLANYREVIPADKMGRVVMMAPPNQGSEIADFLHRFPPYKWVFGPAGIELSTYVQEKANDQIYYEAGVIAGSVSWLYPISRMIIPGESDGRVAVERTKLDALKSHLVLKTSHSFMIYRKQVHHYIISFLKNGVFHHGA